MADRKFLAVVLLFLIAIVLVISPPAFLNNAFGSSTPSKKRSSSSSISADDDNNNNEEVSAVKSETTNSPDVDDENTNAPPLPPPTKKTKPATKTKKQKTTGAKLPYEFPENLSQEELEKLKSSCSVQDLEKVAFYSSSTMNENQTHQSRWRFRNWCSRFTKLSSPFLSSSKKSNNKVSYENSFDPLPFRLDSDQLRSLFQDQVTLFVGDSVVRNHFVLTMARMCNEEHRGKCMIMMPTYEYDIVKPDASQRGPLGCIPKEALEQRMKQSSSSKIITKKNTKNMNSENENSDENNNNNENDETTSSPNNNNNNNSPYMSPLALKKRSGMKMKGIYKKPRIRLPIPPAEEGESSSSGSSSTKNIKNKKAENEEDQQQQDSANRRRAKALGEEIDDVGDSPSSSPPTTAAVIAVPRIQKSPSSSVDTDNLFEAAATARNSANWESLTDCYRNGTFEFVPAPGLTTNREPRRSERKAFLKKGVITPLIRMEVNKAVFYYVPVNTPKQIVKFGKWLMMRASKSRVGSEMAKAKTVFVSTGPHLSMHEMNSSIHLLKPALTLIRSSLGPDSSVLLAETTHLLNGPAWYSEFVDGVMEQWRQELTTETTTTTDSNKNNEQQQQQDRSAQSLARKNRGGGGGGEAENNNEGGDENVNSVKSSSSGGGGPIVDLVPQRFVTIGGYFSSGNNPDAGFVREKDEQEKLRKNRRTCKYYDAQHPAADCQEILTELMLMAAYTSRAKKIREVQRKLIEKEQ